MTKHDLIKEKVLKFENDKEVYLMILIPRSKDNHIVQSQETMHTFVRTLKKVEDCDKFMEELIILGSKLGLTYNLYLNVNPRCVMKSYHALKKKMAEWDYHLINGDMDSVRSIKKLDRYWQTCLQFESSKSVCNYFLIDVDTKDENTLKLLRNFFKFNGVVEELIVKTRNGYHLLVKPFNCKLFYDWIGLVKLPIELLKDRLIQVYYSDECGDK
jgi:hypothetical protein